MSGTCEIWNLRLRASMSSVAQINGSFRNGGPCPASVAGDAVVVDQQTTPNTFLGNAVELVLDGRGDDDGLCESGEACAQSPHLGAFQGNGTLAAMTCRFADGVATGVAMHAFTTAVH